MKSDPSLRSALFKEVLTPTMDDNKEIVWGTMKYLMEHPTSKQCYRLETPKGFVEVTEDHSVFEYTKRGKIKEVAPTSANNLILNTGMTDLPKSTTGIRRDLMTFYGLHNTRRN